MKQIVIDVSRHQGVIDWQQVKAAGIGAVIIRCGYGDDIPEQDDAMWKENVAGAKEAGLKIGAYLYSYADSIAHAQSEAAHALRLLEGITLDFPMFYDMEDEKTTGNCDEVLLGDMAETFCNVLQNAGYRVGIYANKYWFTTKLTDVRFRQWEHWVAQYAERCTYEGSYVGWQYTSKGQINGIQGNVDMSEFYVDYENDSESDAKTIFYQVKTIEDGWLPVIKNLEDYAGWRTHPIVGIAIAAPGYAIQYRVHVTSGQWLPYVTGFDTNDYQNGWAGNNTIIDAIEIICKQAVVKYRVQAAGYEQYFDWQYNNRTDEKQDGYAGVFGRAVIKLQAHMEA